MKHDHVGAAELEVLKAANHALGLVEQIGDEHDHAALVSAIGELVQRLGDVGLLSERQPIERDQQRAQMPGRELAGSI